MNSIWWIAILILPITCDQFGQIHRKRNNIRRERMCITSRGKRGICLPPNICGRYASHGNPNDILRYLCKRHNGKPMVCCSVNRSWFYNRKITSRNYDSLLIDFAASATDISSSNYVYPLLRALYIDPESASVLSVASTGGTNSSNLVRPISNTFPFTDSPESVSSSFSASVTDSKPSSSVEPVSSALSSIAPARAVVYKRSLISGAYFLSPFQSTVGLDSTPTATDATNTSSTLIQQLSSGISSTTSPGKDPVTFTVSLNSNSLSGGSDPSSSSSSPFQSSTEVPTTSSISTSSPKLVENDYASSFPEPPVCGVSQGLFSRVVGGNNASLGDFPWIGVVAYRASRGFVFKCGASLITSQHTLTAAHCIVGNENTLYFVRLGELDLADHNHTRPVDAVVKTMITHDKYSTVDGTNDIGLLVFYRRVIFTDIIRPICLPLSIELRSNNFVGYSPFVAGWGRTKYQGPAPTRLQMLQITVVSQESCSAAYSPFKVVIDERTICAGGIIGKDACNGDSGGPLMQPIWDPINYTTYFYQTGIVSLGMKCGTVGFPGVYTRVSEFIPWIQEHVLGTHAS